MSLGNMIIFQTRSDHTETGGGEGPVSVGGDYRVNIGLVTGRVSA